MPCSRRQRQRHARFAQVDDGPLTAGLDTPRNSHARSRKVLHRDVENGPVAPTTGCATPVRGRQTFGGTMKYLLMIYGNQQTWAEFDPDDLTKAIAEQDAFN